MPTFTTPFASRFSQPRPGVNPQESLDVLANLRPGPAAAPPPPAPGTQLGPGVTQIGSIDGDVGDVGRQRFQADERINQAVSHLTRMAGAQRGIHQQGIDDADFDMEFRAPGRANLQANAADEFSERGAQRAFLPGAKALHSRERGDAMQDSYGRYQLPAEIAQEGTLGAAELRRQGTVGAAEVRAQAAGNPQDNIMLKGLIDAMINQQPDQGQGINPAEIDKMVQYLVRSQGGGR